MRAKSARPRKPTRKFTPEEVRFLQAKSKDYTLNELAQMLDRPYRNLHGKLQRLGLTYKRESKDEIQAKKRKFYGNQHCKQGEQEGGKREVHDREVTDLTVTLVCGDVYHGLKKGKDLADILKDTAKATNRSYEAVKNIYEANKWYIKVIDNYQQESSIDGIANLAKEIYNTSHRVAHI